MGLLYATNGNVRIRKMSETHLGYVCFVDGMFRWSNITSNGNGTGQAPFYQMQQYYRVGKLDDCTKKFSDLFDCLSLKTKTASEAEKIMEEQEQAEAAKHIWIMRTREEASCHWNETFGHLDDPNY
ncbi:hypothetical protein DY000_02027296 [Brassica cretica]|uniref:Uncharacterized protein n=1 Tax=Brassica cretica TaxID=69181 RepID=A0ABQ7EEC4_BRACR|nr:hypothetical protein DY000_02027296 [Brassica cretica]